MTLWTPSNLSSCVGWYDANDPATITNVSGKASQWNDKSPNANHVSQGTASNRPTITASGINGLGTLTFASGNFLANAALSGFPSLSTGFGFGIAMLPTSLAVRGPWDISDTTSTNRTALLTQTAAGTAYVLRSQNANAGSIAYTDTTNAHVVSGTISTTLRDPYLDGTQGTTNSTSQVSLDSLQMRIGELFQNVNPFVGQIGELVYFSGAASTDRQIVEGYLAWRWGLQANLPGDHPYAGAAPTISVPAGPVGLVGMSEAEY